MLENNDLTQDEQLYPGLTQQLQQNYPINQADQQSLQRIRARIQQAHEVIQQNNNHRDVYTDLHTGQFIHPPTRRHTHPWLWRIGILAALLLITLLSSPFFPSKFNPFSVIGKTTPQNPQITPVVVKKKQPSLIRIHMTNSTTGWGEATKSNAQKIIVHTTDGGRSWDEARLPAPYTSFIIPFFLDTTTAWVIPGTALDVSGTPLLRTTNGGKSWEKFQIPGETSEITFVDKQNGWAMDVSQKGQNIMQPEFAIFHTTDGGKSWKQISKAQAGTTNITPGPFPAGEVGTGTFLNRQKGWFYRGSISVAGHESNKQALYITQDGGKSWQLQQLPLQSSGITLVNSADALASLSLPKFFDAQHGSVLVYAKDQAKIHIAIYNTADSGQTWQQAGNTFSKVANKNVKSFSSVALIDTSHFILVDKNEVGIYELTGGQWQEKYKTIQKGLNSSGDAYFIDKQTGWLVANQDPIVNKQTKDQTLTSLLYMTNDSGKSWQKIQQGSYVIPASALQGG